MLQGIKYVLVELIVVPNATNNRSFQFVPQEFLRKKKIVSIETYSVNDIPISPQGNAVMSLANMQQGFLTLYGADPDSPANQQPLGSNPTPVQGEWLKQIPLVSLHRVSNGTDPYVRDLFEIEPRWIAWELSKVDVPVDLGLADANASFLFLVGYTGEQSANS